VEDYISLAPDKSKPRKFLYHQHKQEIENKKTECIIVYKGQEKDWYPKGWNDSPAAFFNMKEHGVPAEKMPDLHKEIDDINTMVNDEINLDAMEAPELKDYVKKYMPGLKFFANAKKATMLKLIKDAKADSEKKKDEFINGDHDNTSEDN
jgi:hypothetical protein